MSIEIRSYRSVFDLERRIYRIDRLRLNPGGIPVRGVVYFLALLLAALLSARAPLLGAAVTGALPWYLRDLVLPAGGAALLTAIRIEGRPFHLAARALLRHAAGPRWLMGVGACGAPGRRWRLEELLRLPDGSDAGLRRLRYSGPGAVLVTVAHERIEWRGGPPTRLWRGPQLALRELPGRRAPRSAQVIALRPGARLRVR